MKLRTFVRLRSDRESETSILAHDADTAADTEQRQLAGFTSDGL